MLLLANYPRVLKMFCDTLLIYVFIKFLIVVYVLISMYARRLFIRGITKKYTVR